MNDRTRDLVDAAPGVIAIGTLGVVALAAVLGFGNAVPVVAVLGWLFLTPLSAILGEVLVPDDESATEPTPDPAAESRPASDPVDRLRERYAAGDIDEDEFERRLDLLLDTEGVDAETARDRVRRRGDRGAREHEAEFER